MSQRQLRLGLAAFLLLTTGVAANLLWLQGANRVASARAGIDQSQAKAAQRERQLALEVPKPAGQVAAAGRGTAGVRPEIITAEPSVADQGETTRAIQRELQLRGYLSGASDGVAGLVTRAAIMAFEHDNGLVLTAEPSEDLLKRILLGAAAVPQNASATKEKRGQPELIIRTVQQTLSGLGYNTGKADGRLGEDTQRAIRDFESDNGMTESGRVSAHLVAKLAKLAGNGRLTASR